MATSCHRFLRCNNITEEDDDTLPSFSSSLQHHQRRRRWQCAIFFFFSNTKKTKHTKKQQKKNQEKGRNLPSSSRFALSFLAPTSTLLFQMFSLLASFSSQTKEKKRKKNHREEKKCREGRELSFKLPFYLFTFDSRFYLPTSTLLFQTLSWHLLVLKQKKKKITKKRKP